MIYERMKNKREELIRRLQTKFIQSFHYRFNPFSNRQQTIIHSGQPSKKRHKTQKVCFHLPPSSSITNVKQLPIRCESQGEFFLHTEQKIKQDFQTQKTHCFKSDYLISAKHCRSSKQVNQENKERQNTVDINANSLNKPRLVRQYSEGSLATLYEKSNKDILKKLEGLLQRVQILEKNGITKAKTVSKVGMGRKAICRKK